MTIEEEINSIKEQLRRIEQLIKLGQSFNKEILNVQEAAEFCGLKVSYIYKLCSLREIPHYKNSGRMLRFKKDELEPWLLRNKVKSKNCIEKEANSYIVRSKL